MTEVLDLERTEEIISAMRIPEQPQVLLDLRSELARETPDIARIAECVERDVGLAAMVLRTVNSPLFGSIIEVRSLRHATVMLGLRNLANVVTGLALRRGFEDAGGEQPAHFWESPANVGLLAAHLAKRLGGVAPDEAYMLGLFRDCGEVLLDQRFEGYSRSVALARAELEDGCRFTEIEDDRYDTNHAVVGYLVSRSWNLPSALRTVILEHHQACARFEDGVGGPTPELTLLAILKLAEHVDSLHRNGTVGPEWRALREPVADYFRMSGPDIDETEADLLEMLTWG